MKEFEVYSNWNQIILIVYLCLFDICNIEYERNLIGFRMNIQPKFTHILFVTNLVLNEAKWKMKKICYLVWVKLLDFIKYSSVYSASSYELYKGFIGHL